MANYKIQTGAKDGVIREDQIYDWFSNKENAALCNYSTQPFHFVRKIGQNVDDYLRFAEGRASDGSPSVALANLKRLCGGAFSLHYVLLLSVASFPIPLFDYFVRQLESFLFYYIFTRTPTRELERSFSAWADELRLIAETSDPVTQKTKLNEFIENRFQASIRAKSNELADVLGRYTIRSMQQYRTRYLLAKLTQYNEKKVLYAECMNYLTASIAGLRTVGNNSSITRINDRLQAFDQWNKQAIEDRQKIIATLTRNVWQTRLVEA